MMNHAFNIIQDICTFAIFRYWLLSLAICVGIFIPLIGFDLLNIASLFDPLQLLSYALPSEEFDSQLLGLFLVKKVIVGTLFSLVFVFVVTPWFSYGVVLLIVLSFFNTPIIRVIRDKHYPEVPLIDGVSFFPLLIAQCKIFVFYCIALLMIVFIMIAALLILSWWLIPVLTVWNFFLYRSLLFIGSSLRYINQKNYKKNGDYSSYLTGHQH